jgi:hypothetical protein
MSVRTRLRGSAGPSREVLDRLAKAARSQMGREVPVTAHGAVGVRWPRPCPFVECGDDMVSNRDRERHVSRHILDGRLR